MLELEQAKKRVQELRGLIDYNNHLYYDQDAPELEDFQYDALTRELRGAGGRLSGAGHSRFPHPAGGGGAPSSRFAKVTHAVKMESLLDAFSYEELRDFDRPGPGRGSGAGVCGRDQDRRPVVQFGV